MPYFVPDATVQDALCAAIHRGVDVALILPAKNESRSVSAARSRYHRKLPTAGAEIHEFRHGLLHAKTMASDGGLSLIGSTNIELRSFDLNYENTVLIWDRKITAAIHERRRDRCRRGRRRLSVYCLTRAGIRARLHP